MKEANYRSAYDDVPSSRAWQDYYRTDPRAAMAFLYDMHWATPYWPDERSRISFTDAERDAAFKRMVKILRTRPLLLIHAKDVMSDEDFRRLEKELSK